MIKNQISAFYFLLEQLSLSREEDGLDAYMQAAALKEAHLAVGRTSPNPPVGAVIEDYGKIISRGHTQKAGLEHAEKVAVLRAEKKSISLEASKIYTTLEPCVHSGKTPPCTQLLIDRKVAGIEIACFDPNPQVNGAGYQEMRDSGVEVSYFRKDLADRAEAIIKPFEKAVKHKKPYVIAKLASTLDGKIATQTGHSEFVSGAESRELVHRLRDHVDMIMVGRGTAEIDNPSLNVRLDSHLADVELMDTVPDKFSRKKKNPRRVVLDTKLSLSLTSHIFDRHVEDFEVPISFCSSLAPNDRLKEYRQSTKVNLQQQEGENLDLSEVMTTLCSLGHHTILVETGPTLLASLLKAQLIDELWWFTAPKVVGATGKSAVADLEVCQMTEAITLPKASYLSQLGDDILQVFLLESKL